MPNWVYNEVEIEAPLAEVQSYLAEDSDPDGDDGKTLRFNLHRLYPEKFEADDLCGHKGWDYDWMIENTGAKWNPSIHCASEN